MYVPSVRLPCLEKGHMRLINDLLASGTAFNVIVNIKPQAFAEVLNITQAATSVATIVLCSALIVTRIYKMSIPNSAYSTVATMMIESASLYSVTAVIWMAFHFIETERIFEGTLYIESFFTAMIVSPQNTFHVHEFHETNPSVFHQL
jgi:hypothetical protein